MTIGLQAGGCSEPHFLLPGDLGGDVATQGSEGYMAQHSWAQLTWHLGDAGSSLLLP